LESYDKEVILLSEITCGLGFVEEAVDHDPIGNAGDSFGLIPKED
jgi:hypothetical protein